ncbi:hypothetical protein K1719_026968 [Acacia pycnantha]|nr:hypothetical protein K1719_026968 [Acacia pycnantha]
MNSDSLFDPLLLAAFEQAVKDHVELRKSAEKVQYFEERVEEKEVEQQEDEELPWKVLEVFEEKCPPGGNGSVSYFSTGNFTVNYDNFGFHLAIY